MILDRFELVIDPAAFIRWPGGGGYQPAEVRINGRPLIELARVAELPWARAEYAGRFPEEKDADALAGQYHYLSDRTVLLPSREWLGSPSWPGSRLDAHDPRGGKAMVLGCTCGAHECWFLQARIEVGPEVVRWSQFGQFHRPHWVYDLGPFTFDRREYEAQLSGRKGA